MDNNPQPESFIQSGWTIYILAVLVLVVLFFVQKYAYLIDRKLNAGLGKETDWEGKPWSLISALLLGVIVFVLGVFLPGDLNINPKLWYWPEIFILILTLMIFTGLSIESFSHFGKSLGAVRLVIFAVLSLAFYYAGLLMGLFLAAILALGVIVYFLFFWKRRVGKV